jgi:RimJ/RimL family protein N-acetyltransferase
MILDASIPVLSPTNELLGYLSSFSFATLADPARIELIRSWRQRHRLCFFTQFDETTARTVSYVESVIADPHQLMFFICTPADQPIGHLGVKHLDQPTPELNNLIRGRVEGDRHLMQRAEVALLSWLFRDRGFPRVCCQVFDDNWLVLKFHSRAGFRVIDKLPLVRRVAEDGEVRLQPWVEGADGGELIATKLAAMELTAEEFFRLQDGE